MKFTQIPVDTFKTLQMNAGIIVESFNPATGVVGRLLGATTGGLQFQDAMEFKDFGEDIDNCPKNMLELKKLDSHDVTVSGTFVTMSADTAKTLAGAADVDPHDETHIVPRNDLLASDFKDLWLIGDYSDKNTGDNAGFLAIHLLNALNTGGFQIQTQDKDKGQFAFTFTGHYSMEAQDRVPYEIYIKEGEEVAVGVTLNKMTTTIGVGGTDTIVATTVPETAVVTWSSNDETVATVNGGVVTGVGAGSAAITAEIVVAGVPYTATCAVTVSAEQAELTNLTIGSLTLTPEFDTATTEYTATTSNATNTITATVSGGGTATIEVNDVEIENGGTATWEAGENTVEVTVGETVYTVTVTKE